MSDIETGGGSQIYHDFEAPRTGQENKNIIVRTSREEEARSLGLPVEVVRRLAELDEQEGVEKVTPLDEKSTAVNSLIAGALENGVKNMSFANDPENDRKSKLILEALQAKISNNPNFK